MFIMSWRVNSKCLVYILSMHMLYVIVNCLISFLNCNDQGFILKCDLHDLHHEIHDTIDKDII